MTRQDAMRLAGLRLCDLYTPTDGVRYRSIGDAADIFAVVKPDGHTLHDYEARFAAEDAGLIDPEARFRWEIIGRQIIRPRVKLPGQMRMEDLIDGVQG